MQVIHCFMLSELNTYVLLYPVKLSCSVLERCEHEFLV